MMLNNRNIALFPLIITVGTSQQGYPKITQLCDTVPWLKNIWERLEL